MNSIQRFLNTWAVALTAVLALAFIIMVPLFVSSDQSVMAQTSPEPGDYRSVHSGNWNSVSNWEVWDGDSWDGASIWPGQNPADDYTVTIQSGHVISDNNVNTLYFGDLIVYGHLNLSNSLYLKNTSYILIDNNFYDGIDITTGGSIRWLNKLELHLPVNAALGVNVKDDSGTVIEGLGLDGSNSGNNKMRLVIGTIDYAAATGGGNVEYTFDEINENGGILSAIASVNPEEFNYQGSLTTFTTILTGEATGLGSRPEYTTFAWTGTGPNGFLFSYNGQNPGPVNLGYSSGAYIFTLTAESNYDNFTYSTSQDATVIIHPALLTITVLDQAKEYDETFPYEGTFTGATVVDNLIANEVIEITGLQDGDTVDGITLTCDGADANTEVGAYDIIPSAVSVTGPTNYTMSYVSGTLWIGNPTITITVLNQTKEYGVNFPYQGTFTGATAIDNLIANEVIEITGLLDGDSVESITLISSGAVASATVSGSGYSYLASNAQGTGLGNYTIMYVNGVLTVNPKPLTITAQSSSKTYGDTVTFTGTEFTSEGLVNGDSISSVTLSSNGAAASATVSGSAYTIKAGNAQGTGLDNYSIVYDNGVLTVNPRSLTITAQSSSKTYGDTVTFTGTEFTSEGLVNSDTVNSVTLISNGAAAFATVGTYPIMPSESYGTGLENYTISYINGTLSVTDNPLLIITALEQVKEYGNTFTFEGTEFIVNGLRDGDSVNRVTLTSDGATAPATVGTYTIVPSEADGTGLENYTITYVNGSLTVDPRALTITANSTSKTYGDTITFTGTEFDSESPVNDDMVVIASAEFHSFDPVDSDMVGIASNEFDSEGLINGDAIVNVKLTSSGADAAATVDSSPYAILASNATGSGLDNYTITYIGGKLSVSPLIIHVTASLQSKTRGEADPALAYTYSPDLVGNDTFTGSLTREIGEDAGNYAITQGTLSLSSSYILDYTGADLTIVKMQAPFEVNNLIITPSTNETWAGITFTRDINQDVLITVEVSNTGGQSETYHGVLKLNGEEITSNDITLESGNIGQLTFTLSDLPTGDYTVEIEDLRGEFSTDKWTNIWLISNLFLTVIFIGYLIKRYAFKRDTGSRILEEEN